MRRVVDVTPPALLALFGLAQVAGLPAGDEYAGPAWVDALMVLATAVPLCWRRTVPGPALLAVVIANLVWTQLLFAPTDEVVLETWFLMLLGVWALAVHGSRKDVPWALAALVLEVGAAIAEWVRGVPADQQAVPLVSFVVAIAAGLAVRRQHDTSQLLEQRTRELEAEREARAREAVELERARIARELHDQVTHGLTGVILHAAADRERLAPSDPTAATLADIEHLARTSLTDLRRLLGLLRTSPDGLGPHPDLASLDELVDTARGAGLDVRLAGDPVCDVAAGLDHALSLNAYRIIQEALTNAMRHAPGSSVDVVVRRECTGLSLEVENSASPLLARTSSAPGRIRSSGHGLVGVRERARLFGGTADLGPTTAGGYRVAVRLGTGTATS